MRFVFQYIWSVKIWKWNNIFCITLSSRKKELYVVIIWKYVKRIYFMFVVLTIQSHKGIFNSLAHNFIFMKALIYSTWCITEVPENQSSMDGSYCAIQSHLNWINILLCCQFTVNNATVQYNLLELTWILKKILKSKSYCYADFIYLFIFRAAGCLDCV